MSNPDSAAKFCPRCKAETKRYANGQCGPCSKACATAWQAANPDRRRATTAEWYAANRDKAKASAAAYRASHPERKKANTADWRAANPEAMRVINHNYRARKRKNGGTLSKGLTAKLFKLQKGKCACCKQLLGDNYHLDHIMPIALGGQNIDSNIQLLRQRCNNQKHSANPVDFMQSRGFLL